MNKKFEMENLGTKVLIGRKIISASINKEKDLVILDTDKGKLFLTWEGDSFSSCYLYHVSGVDALVGATIVAITPSTWQQVSQDDNGDAIASTGTNIKTDKGYVTFETRLEHNGYYSGNVMISDDEPMDQYHHPRYGANDKVEVIPLKDF